MVRVGSRYLLSLVVLAVAAGLAGPVRAQTDKPVAASDPKSGVTGTEAQAAPADQVDPLKRSPSEKQKKQQKRNLNIELSKTYKKWLNEDVVWIITDEERAAFKQLSNDEERDNFIEAFWQRRDPTPDTEENEYKEEHYRRIAYANEHFAAGIPGWKSDRGRIYIMYGPADEIDSHPSGGTYERPMEEGGGETSTFPFEDWRYRYLEGIGQEIIIEFVDTCMCGDYHMTIDRSEKDALKYDAQRRPHALRADGHGQQNQPLHQRRVGTAGRRPDEQPIADQGIRPFGDSTRSCKRRRRSNTKIWKKSSTPNCSPT